MKATEYFTDYKRMESEKGHNYAIVEIFTAMYKEIGTIQKDRNSTANNVIIAITNEINQKANSFIRLVNKELDGTQFGKIKRDAFKIFVTHEVPDFAKVLGWCTK